MSELNAPNTGSPSAGSSIRSGAGWRWATHCLFGLLLGTIDVALRREPWNGPINWVAVYQIFFIMPAYFILFVMPGQRWRVVAAAVLTVALCHAVGFESLFITLHHRSDIDFIIGHAIVAVVYVVLFGGTAFIAQLPRRKSTRG